MSDERRDDEAVGQALGRAVGSQTVRETPYAASRLAHRIDRPAGRGWTYALPMAAALALFVAMGAFFATRGPQSGVATPNASVAPSASGTAPAATAPAAGTATPSQATPRPVLVYFGRDGLPPVAGVVSAAGGPSTGRPEDSIGTRLSALFNARANEVPPGAINAAALPSGGTTSISVNRIDGDLATVEIGITGGWPARGATQSQALLQQLVYTITEEPGIRRAMIKDQGKQTATIDQLVIDKPLSREDVFGYTPMAPADQRVEIDGTAVPADLTSKIDHVQTGGPGQPVRLVIDLAPRQPVPGGSWLPAFTASMQATTGAAVAKHEIVMTVPAGTETSLRDQAIDVTPLRYVRVTGNGAGTTYRLGVDDARPWRVSVAPGVIAGGMRLYLDIGGYPQMVNRNIAVYAPSAGQSVTSSITISGVARVFEANVTWRLRDANGREVAKGFTTATIGTGPVWGSFQTSVPIPAGVTGQATLEVFWGSPRDGSDQDVVSIPLRIR